MRYHGDTPPVPFVPAESDDPDMWLVTVDMDTWAAVHEQEEDDPLGFRDRLSILWDHLRSRA